MLLYGSYMRGAGLKWKCLVSLYTLFCFDLGRLQNFDKKKITNYNIQNFTWS
jgi:hypothetical protein